MLIKSSRNSIKFSKNRFCQFNGIRIKKKFSSNLHTNETKKTENSGKYPELSKKQKDYLDGLIRVDQAGELGADLIYAGQYAVLSRTRPELEGLIKHMWEQEQHHRSTFNKLQQEHRVRPSLLTPIWKVAAYGIGVATALKGKEAAMACTEAVETVIGGHYNEQLRFIDKEFGPKSEMYELSGFKKSPEIESLESTVSQFRDDELEHLNTALENDAKEARPYWLLTETIMVGCKAAIWLAKRC